MRVSVLGGTGLLGSNLRPILEKRGHDVAVYSRSTDPPFDLENPEGRLASVVDADVVVHLASNPRKPHKVDVGGTRSLLEHLEGCRLVYMSIVGVDRHAFPYYQAKHQVEGLIAASGHDHAIIRSTQFHHFLGFVLSKVCRPPIALVPRSFVFQPIEVTEVARSLADVVDSGETGLLPDIAGPEVLGVEHLARSYMTAIGRERPLVRYPVPGKIGRAFRDGLHANPDRAVGKITWAQYLEDLTP